MTGNEVTIPAGFTTLADSPEELRIAYRSTGMGCMLTFLVICLFVFTGVFSYFAITRPADFRWLVTADWWAPLACAAGLSAIVYWTGFVLFHLFGETVILITPDDVAVSRRLFGLTRTRLIPRVDISCVQQVKDGGEGDDSFPSWGLRVVGRRKCWLIKRQPIEKSDWLGGRLAERLHVSFEVSEKRPG